MNRIDWVAVRSNRFVRSAAQGFLAGAGLGAYAGEYAVLSLDAAWAGLLGAVSMTVLSVVMWFAVPVEQ